MALFGSTRRVRLLRVITARWERRLIFVFGGVSVGAAAVGLALLSDLAQAEFRQILGLWPYASFVATPLGFALAVYLTRRYFPNCQGSGIPQAIAARQLKDHKARTRLVSIRVAVGKVILTLLGLLCGASAGREGPTVQIGASILFAVGRMSPRIQPGLILAGGAAGVAAAFNTPLAGIVFGIEEMSRSFEARTSGIVVAAVIAAGLTSMAMIGNYTYFGATTAMLQSGVDWLAIPVCGIVGGLMGGIFSRILISVAKGSPGVIGRWIKRNPVPFAAICGLSVAAVGYVSHGTIYGTGYEQVKRLINGAGLLPEAFGVFKMAATALTSISGIPGGIFSPSLAVGAGFGANIVHFFPGAPPGAIILLGMVSYFAGVVQAPITAFVIVTEMSDNHAMLLPLMAASLVAHATSKLICPEGVYHALSRNFLAMDQAP